MLLLLPLWQPHIQRRIIGLAASLGYGAASEIVRRTGGVSHDPQSSVFMTEANIKRLVSKLSQMRGAALKLGQFLSIQGTAIFPPVLNYLRITSQIPTSYRPKSIKYSDEFKTVLITCLTGKWRYVHLGFSSPYCLNTWPASHEHIPRFRLDCIL